jgi:hypothetical protein
MERFYEKPVILIYNIPWLSLCFAMGAIICRTEAPEETSERLWAEEQLQTDWHSYLCLLFMVFAMGATTCRTEAPEETSERLWAEEQLRTERRRNLNLGIAERLDVMMARVQMLHQQTRVQPQLAEYNVSELAGGQPL